MLYQALTTFFVAGLDSAAVAPRNNNRAYATYYYNIPDLLEGQDGIPIHPTDYQVGGELAISVAQDGNGMEQVEAHISYYEGSYWLSPATWSCGKFVYGRKPGRGNINATAQGGAPNPTTPRGSSPVACGINTDPSPDLTNWKLEILDANDNLAITPTKPVVRYSNTTGLNVMLLGNQQLTTFNQLTSKSPAGPWTDYRTLSGPYIGHDSDIAVAPNGDHWMLSDTFSSATVVPKPGLPATIGIS